MFLADQLADLVKHLAVTQVTYMNGPSRPHISSVSGFRVQRGANTGALAQLGEHLLCKQGVIGSIPIRSTRWVGSSGG